MLSLENSFRGTTKENKSIISVLEDGARGIRDERVEERGGEGGIMEEATENISNNDEEIRGEGVALPKAVAAVDPFSRHPVQ
jgi:hypothetical protein